MQYKIAVPSADPKEALIEKRGHVISFTLGQVESNTMQNKKIERELIGFREVNAAKVANIEQHHPFVLKMSEQDLFTVHMYQEAKAMVKGYESKLKEVVAQIASDDAEVEEIKKQIPELAATVSPIQAENLLDKPKDDESKKD